MWYNGYIHFTYSCRGSRSALWLSRPEKNIMQLTKGQKVSYPNQGVCRIEDIEKKTIGGNKMQFYSLRVLSDDSIILVPTDNAESIGVRPIISNKQCKSLWSELESDFEPISDDWKTRSRQFTQKLQSGDVFEAADVLKKLTFLSHEKKLSFREQSLLEKAKFLIVSEICSVPKDASDELKIDSQVVDRVACACSKHLIANPPEEKVAAAH